MYDFLKLCTVQYKMDSSGLLEGKQFITTSEGTISPTTWHLNCSYLLLVLNNFSVNLTLRRKSMYISNTRHIT